MTQQTISVEELRSSPCWVLVEHNIDLLQHTSLRFPCKITLWANKNKLKRYLNSHLEAIILEWEAFETTSLEGTSPSPFTNYNKDATRISSNYMRKTLITSLLPSAWKTGGRTGKVEKSQQHEGRILWGTREREKFPLLVDEEAAILGRLWYWCSLFISIRHAYVVMNSIIKLM